MSLSKSSSNEIEAKVTEHQLSTLQSIEEEKKSYETLNLLDDGADPVYEAKARVLNKAIQEIGMGKYQWLLFIVAGFGWFADNLWTNIPSLVLVPVTNEFRFQGPFLNLSLNAGLLFGALFWGLGCDIWGRRWPFNITLLIISIFSIASGGSSNSSELLSLTALYSIGVGGNLPVDSAVFLEFIPGSHQYLLSMLTVWRALGQLTGGFIAWPLLADLSCPIDSTICPHSQNRGWRYYMFIQGSVMFVLWAIRFFVFKLYESPKFLMGKGKDEAAVKVIHAIATYNGKTSSLSIEHLLEAERSVIRPSMPDSSHKERERGIDHSTVGGALRAPRRFDLKHVKSLFETKKLAWNTSFLILLWGLIGLAFPLYDGFITFFLATRGEKFGDGSLNVTYRNQAILSVVAVPAAFAAGWAVELPYLGRKGTLACSTAITGIFLFASTTSKSSNALLGWNAGYTFSSTIMHGVLYAITPELFPTKDRGTGNALTASAYRTFGVLSPIVALFANLETSAPIWIAGALLLLAGLVASLLPFEPRGRTSV